MFPSHDPKLVSLVYDIFDELQPDQIVINGDYLDFFNLNAHQPKDPEVLTSLEDEFNQGYELLKELRDRNPEADIVFIAGNHEHRLDRFTMKHCPAFYNILTTEKMLRLEDINIHYLPYQTAFRVEETNLYIQHSPPSYGKTGSRTSLIEKPGASFIYGCTHRLQQSHINDFYGNIHSVYYNGCLASPNYSEEHKRVFAYAKGHQNWQQAFSIVTVFEGKEFFVEQIAIRNYKCIVDGALYEA